MNPRTKRFSERLRQLITEGSEIARLERPSAHGGAYIQDHIPLKSWLVRVDNIVAATFGRDSIHYAHLHKELEEHPNYAYQIEIIIGILTGGLEDLGKGYLVGQEHLIAADLFDTLLDQAAHLLSKGFKDPAAVLGRVVLEDSLRRIGEAYGCGTAGKPSSMNDKLLKAGQYGKPPWRQIQAWLDIGNAAAHGKGNAFTDTEVAAMLNGVRDFLANSFES